MARFCGECGKEIADGVSFCTECGTNVSESPALQTEQPDMVQPQPQQTYQSPVQNNQQPQQTSLPPLTDRATKVVGIGTYFGLMLLFALPIIGFIACIIMAFAPKNKNIKNFARAVLIWMIIAFIIAGLLFVLGFVFTNSLIDYISQIGEGYFGDFGETFNQFSEFGNAMNEFSSMTEQLESGGFGTVPLE